MRHVEPGHANGRTRAGRPAAMHSPVAPVERWLGRVWWRASPGAAAWLLWPLSLLYRLLADVVRRMAGQPAAQPVPVIVVGNLVVGGAGKTPVVIALVQALRAAGRQPAVISRGHGRQNASRAGATPDGARGAGAIAVTATSSPGTAGDEPLLIARRTGVPVYVGRRRADVARAVRAGHPEVDVIVSDDGLQHHALARVAELIVFDDRGAGNGLLLPAGPLREPLPDALPTISFVVYSGRRASTHLPGLHVPRHATLAVPLASWSAGGTAGAQPLTALRGRRMTALAGIGAPEQFFGMLEAAGVVVDRLPCRDHADYAHAPWPPGTQEVVTTEKDAVKLAALPLEGVRVWVVPLDCELPDALVRELLRRLPRPQDETR